MRIFSNLLPFLFFSVTAAHGFGNLIFSIPHALEILEGQSYINVSEKCMDHLRGYLQNLQNGENWAWQMFDSITKFPDGIFLGRSNFPGHFDECVEATNENFQGKHCMLVVKFKSSENFLMPKNVPEFGYLSDFFSFETINFSLSLKNLAYIFSATEGLTLGALDKLRLGIFRVQGVPQNQKLAMQKFRFGLCVPSTCSPSDIENVIQNTEELNFIDVKLNETDCSTNGYRPLRSEDWVTLCVIIVIVVIALLSTVYDCYQRFVVKTENLSQLWTAFSIYTTGQQLFRISQTSTQLKCLHGMRFLSMCWVIIAHAYFSFLFSSSINPVEIPKMMNDKSFTPISNAFVSVDSFFFLSGLLVCLVFFRDISKKGSYDVPVAFLHRYIRLTPPFAILILIQATLISRIGNGPFWNANIDAIENTCRESWWSGILYIQNYLHPMAMCLGQAWYLSADMQMYWISPFILYPLLWFPSYAPVFLGFLVLVASFTNFTIAYLNNLQPSLLIKWGFLTGDQFKIEYAPFHTRMAPWLIGLATGYIICGIQAKKINIHMPKFWTLCGWLACFGILGGTIFGIVRFFPDNILQSNSDNYTTAEAALYLAFHRVGWSLGLAWVVIACISGHGGPINKLLSLDFFQPLAKLSYCNFLIHMTLQQYRINSSRTNQYLRHFDVVYAYFGDLLVSHLISIPITLLFEFPFTNLDRHFLQKLVIFPLPKKEFSEKKTETEKFEKSESPEDVEKGKTNQAFNET